METSPHSPAVERCRATVLFADIVGFSDLSEEAGTELAYTLVTGALRLLDGIARRHGGAVDKYLGDALMAVFGWPVKTAGAASALEAAVEMQSALAEYVRDVASPVPLSLQIGINTGALLAADVRGPLVREFAVMGDPVNVAARLKDLAPSGGIFVGEQTRAEAGDGFSYRSLSPLKLKGKETRIHTYAVEARIAGAPSAPAADALRIVALVGRDEEMARLRRRLGDLREGRGGFLGLHGDSGCGKSRLLAELAESPEAKDLRVETLRAPDGETLARAVAGARPLALLLDDLHDAPPAAAERLAEIVSERAPDLLVIAAWRSGREGAMPAVLEAAASAGADPPLLLPPLPAPEARALVDAVLAQSGTPEEIREIVVARAAGNPFRLVTGALLAPALESEAARDALGVARGSEAERRRATVLFADITGFTALTEKLEPVEAHRIVSGCLRVLDEASRKHGASVDKYLGDCVMAVFGVPVAIEDAPRAAVNAAIEMRRRVREYNVTQGLASPLDVHIGIDTGLGISGDVSGPVLREYALMGRSVNAASRLKDIAPRGKIYVGEETWKATARQFGYEALEPASRGEGRSKLVHYELLSEREVLHRDRVGSGGTLFRTLVGRDVELSLLRARMAALGEGRGGIAAVIGDPGLGKSRLLAELAASPEAAAVRWLEARSLTIGRTLSFHPFVDLLRAWSGLDEVDEASEAAAVLERAMDDLLGPESEEHLPWIATLLGVPLASGRAARVDAVRGDARDNLTLRSVRTLLAALSARQPLVLCFEDLHWADVSSIELLETVLRLAEEAPILFLLATRPGFPETSGRILRAAREHHGEALVSFDLAPLRSGDTRRLLADLFAHGGLPVGARERIEAQAAGNPFYVEEVIRSLREQDAIEEAPDGLRATPKIHTAVIPGTVQEVILSRVDRLDPVRKSLLQTASVIGRSFSPKVLASLVPGGEDEVALGLARLVEAQLLAVDEDEGTTSFRHPMIQDVTYDAILEGRRKELHCAVGRALEGDLESGRAGVHATLAYHYGRGGDLARAEEHLFAAGDEAARGAASNEALHFFQEASRLYRELHGAQADPRKMALLEKNVGLAYFNRGLLPEASRQFNRALELMGERIPQGRFEMGRRFAGTLLSVLPPLYLPVGARRRPKATPEQHEIIQLMYSRAQAQTTGDPARFLFDTMENLRRLARVDPRTVAGAGGMYASVIGIFSFGGISFSVSERFLGVAREAIDPSNPDELLLFRMMNFVHRFLSGDWAREHEIETDLVEEGLRRGRLWELSTHIGLEGIQQLAQGRFAESRAHIERVTRIEDQYAYDLASSNRHGVTAFWFAERRELDAALEAVETYYTEHDEPMINVLGLGWKAKVQLLRGDPEGARETLAVADGILAKEGLMPPFNRGSVERTRLLVALDGLERARARGERGRARALSKEARRAARRALACARSVAWQRTEVYGAVARLRFALGDARGARRWWKTALDEGARLGTRPERARICAEIARRLGEVGGGTLFGRDARSFRDEARAEFEALSLAWDLRRLEAAEDGARAETETA